VRGGGAVDHEMQERRKHRQRKGVAAITFFGSLSA